MPWSAEIQHLVPIPPWLEVDLYRIVRRSILYARKLSIFGGAVCCWPILNQALISGFCKSVVRKISAAHLRPTRGDGAIHLPAMLDFGGIYGHLAPIIKSDGIKAEPHAVDSEPPFVADDVVATEMVGDLYLGLLSVDRARGKRLPGRVGIIYLDKSAAS